MPGVTASSCIADAAGLVAFESEIEDAQRETDAGANVHLAASK